MTFCVTKWFQGSYHFKRKISTIIKKYNVRTSFPFHTIATWEVLVLDGFLNSAYVISPQKKALTSPFCSSQHAENGRERNTYTCTQFQESYTNILRQRYLQLPADIFTFTKEILKENITSCIARVKRLLSVQSQSKEIIFLRDFDFDFDTYLFSFMTRFHARCYQNVIHT